MIIDSIVTILVIANALWLIINMPFSIPDFECIVYIWYDVAFIKPMHCNKSNATSFLM